MKNFDLLRYLKKWWFLIMIVTAAGCVFVYRFASSKQCYTATAVIQYTNVDSEDGLNADGSKLDTSEITSAAVINRTIEELGLSSNTESIRSRITIEEVVSDDEELRKENALGNGEEYKFTPTIYQVSFTVYEKDASDYARRVLDSLLSNYFKCYGERHVDAELFPNNAVNVSASNYEYVDCVEMLRVNANESIGYLNKRAEEKYGFYSVKTGYSFSDLANSYNYIKNNSLSDLYAYIIANKLVKDCDVLIDKKENDALQYQIQIDSLTKNITEAKDIIDQFGDKTIEGAAKFMFGSLRDILYKNLKNKLAAAAIKKDLYAFKSTMDVNEIGGTAMLGISRPVVKAHGSSDARAIRSAVRQAIAFAEAGVIQAIEENIESMKITAE